MADPSQLTLLTRSVKEWNTWRRAQWGSDIIIDLAGAHLGRANLTGADLNFANLSGADLWGADLSGADLWGADLSGADLQRAELKRTNFSNANLSYANLSRVQHVGVWVWQIAPPPDYYRYRVNFHRANLSNAIFWRANLFLANLRDANLYKAYLYKADLNHANLIGADLTGADLTGADLTGALWDALSPKSTSPGSTLPSSDEAMKAFLASSAVGMTEFISSIVAIAIAPITVVPVLTAVLHHWPKKSNATTASQTPGSSSQTPEPDIVAIRLQMTDNTEATFQEWLTNPARLQHYIDVFHQLSPSAKPVQVAFALKNGHTIFVNVSEGAQTNRQLNEVLSYLHIEPTQQ